MLPVSITSFFLLSFLISFAVVVVVDSFSCTAIRISSTRSTPQTRTLQWATTTDDNNNNDKTTTLVDSSIDQDEIERSQLKQQLFDLSESTNRGFQASALDRQQAKDIILKLSKYSPTKEPALAYYNKEAVATTTTTTTATTLAGKWTLIYTDAPDITGLDTSKNPLATAKLGRIGQECVPPLIKNVIEWQRPDWAGNLPFSGGNSDSDPPPRILQKVVTKGTSNPSQPRIVNLDIAGLELQAADDDDDSNDTTTTTNNIVDAVQEKGAVAGWLSAIGGIDLKGPLNPPFGQFELLYLDDDFRMIRTGQGFFACNVRIQPGEEWF